MDIKYEIVKLVTFHSRQGVAVWILRVLRYNMLNL